MTVTAITARLSLRFLSLPFLPSAGASSREEPILSTCSCTNQMSGQGSLPSDALTKRGRDHSEPMSSVPNHVIHCLGVGAGVGVGVGVGVGRSGPSTETVALSVSTIWSLGSSEKYKRPNSLVTPKSNAFVTSGSPGGPNATGDATRLTLFGLTAPIRCTLA